MKNFISNCWHFIFSNFVIYVVAFLLMVGCTVFAYFFPNAAAKSPICEIFRFRNYEDENEKKETTKKQK